MEGGYLTIARFRGAPIRVHWTFLLVAVWFGRGSPAAWIGFFSLIVVHELGHALLVRWRGHQVDGIEIDGLGGACVWSGRSGVLDDALISWGGVWAQGVSFWIAQTTLDLGLWPDSAFLRGMLTPFLTANVWLIVLNLIPIPPFDGGKAWTLFPILYRWSRFDRTDAELRAKRRTEQPASAPPPVPEPGAKPEPDAKPGPGARPEPQPPASAQEELFQKILRDLDKVRDHAQRHEDE